MDDSKRKKRNQIAVACNECRKRKIKCDGTRPGCLPCSTRSSACSYEADPDATPIIAIKRKYADLQVVSARDHNLLEQLVTQPEPDALALLREIRTLHHERALRFSPVHDPEGSANQSSLPDDPRVKLPSFSELTRAMDMEDHPPVSFARGSSMQSSQGRSDDGSCLGVSDHRPTDHSTRPTGTEALISLYREDSGYSTSQTPLPSRLSAGDAARSHSMTPTSFGEQRQPQRYMHEHMRSPLANGMSPAAVECRVSGIRHGRW